MPILTSRTSLPTSTTKYIRQEQIRFTKTDLLNAHTDQFVIMSVLSLKVLLLISNSGRTPSSTIFELSMPLLQLSEHPLISSKLLERRRTLPTFSSFGCCVWARPPGKHKAKFKSIHHSKLSLVQL